MLACLYYSDSCQPAFTPAPQEGAESAMTQTTTTYAIVTAQGVIVSMHDEPVPAGEGWGHDHELVELTRPHRVGDRIEWDARGIETEAN